MARKAGKGVEALGVRELRERIAQWRRTREKRTAMPEALWQEAVTLAREQGTYAVARGVKIDYQSLARRVAESRGGSGEGSASSTFVELSGVQILGLATPPEPAPVVELCDSEGVRVTIRLGCGARLDVAGLVRSFCQRRS
jgi:hypothetical protein